MSFADTLVVRADALRTLARNTYDQPMREVIYKTSFVLREASEEIRCLQLRIVELERRLSTTH